MRFVLVYHGRALLWSPTRPTASFLRSQGTEREPSDYFGSVLASGDFNADGRADLAVGIPNENVGSIADAGSVQIFFGGASGSTTVAARFAPG